MNGPPLALQFLICGTGQIAGSSLDVAGIKDGAAVRLE